MLTRYLRDQQSMRHSRIREGAGVMTEGTDFKAGHLPTQTNSPPVKGGTTMLLKRTLKMTLLLVGGLATIAVGLAQAVPVAGQDDADTQTQIADAMAAGPASITEHAT